MLLSLLSFIWLVALSTDFPQTNQNELQFLLVEKEGGKNWIALQRMYCFTLNESILYSFRLALFISIYPVNGFSIANYLQNLYQDTFCSCMTGPSVHNTQSAFGLYQQVFYLKEGNSQQGPAEGWLIMILEQSFVGMTGYFYWPQVLML